MKTLAILLAGSALTITALTASAQAAATPGNSDAAKSGKSAPAAQQEKAEKTAPAAQQEKAEKTAPAAQQEKGSEKTEQSAKPESGSVTSVSCASSSITAITTGTLLGCEGSFAGNDNLIQDTVMSALGKYTTGWTYATADKSDSSQNGVFTSNPGDSAGTLTFDSPVFGIFAVVLKAATDSSVFVFDGGTTGIGSFKFTTNGVSVNGSGIAQGLSHASFYRSSTTSFTPPVAPPTPVPEPLTLLGTAAALGLGAVMRRRTQNA